MTEDTTERTTDPFEEGFEVRGVPEFQPASTPRERLRQVFEKNDLDVWSFELYECWQVSCTSFVMGLLIGGIRQVPAAAQTWKKTHYHSLFLNNKDANRYFMDYMNRRFLIEGGRFGLRAGLVTGVLTLTAGCLAARRDKARVTDVGIAGGLASFLYRIDVGPRAMLASGVIGGVFWQLGALAMLPVLRLAGYSWDGFYKEWRKSYYEEENGYAKFVREREQADAGSFRWPWEMSQEWAKYKLMEEERLASLRKLDARAKSKPAAPAEQTVAVVPPKKEDAKKDDAPIDQETKASWFSWFVRN